MYLFTAMPAIQFSMIENTNLLFLGLGYGLTFITAYKYKISFNNKKLLLILGIIIIWTCVQIILHRAYFRLSPFIIMEVLAAFVIIETYKETIYRRFENITYYLCVIALIGWILSIILHSLVTYLANGIGIEASGEKSSTFIIYTVNLTDNYRNCGFGWEPGRFACLTCIGVLFYLIRTKLKFRTLRFWIMTACIASTMSTTGFCVYMAIILLSYWSFHKISILQISIASIFVVCILSLPFMGTKIKDLIGQASGDAISTMGRKLTWNSENNADSDFYIPQRFEGLMFSVMNVMNTNYLIGDGRDFQNFYINRVMDWKVKTSEGVLEIVVRYGVILAILCYYYLYKASVMISSFYKVSNKWLYFVTFILINISYNFWEVPVFMSIWMMPIYLHSKESKHKTSLSSHIKYHNTVSNKPILVN